MGGLSKKHVVQGCEASLKRLGVGTIDLYQIHRWDGSVPLDETLAALDQLVAQGKVRYVGASSGPAYKLAQALALSAARGWARFSSMQNHYNLLYREEEREMLPLCREEGIAVIPWSPLARGLLAGTRDERRRPPRRRRAAPRTTTRASSTTPLRTPTSSQSVKRVAAARGCPPAEVALAWLLSRPGVTAPIVGATKLEHLEAALKAVDAVLTDEEVAALETPYQPHGVRGLPLKGAPARAGAVRGPIKRTDST